jgi:MFS family permease
MRQGWANVHYFNYFCPTQNTRHNKLKPLQSFLRFNSLPATVKNNILKLYAIKIAKWFMLVMPVIVPFYESNGLTLQDIMILKAVYSVVIVVFEIPSGYLADVLGRKNTLIAGALLGTAGYVAYSFSFGFAGFLIAEIVLGAGQSMISGADSALLYDTLAEHEKEDQYTRYEGNTISVGNFAESFAGLAGGFLALISLRTPFYAQALVAFIAIPAAFTLHEPSRGPDSALLRFRDIWYVVRVALFTDPKLRINILFSSVIGAATLSMAWFVQPVFKFTGVSLAMYGILWTGLNVSAGIFSALAYKVERFLGERTTLILICASIPVGFILTALIDTRWVLLILMLFYFVRGVATPVLKDYINRLTKSDMRATVLSVRSFVIRILFAIIAPLMGRVSDAYDVGVSLMVSGIIFSVILFPLLLIYIKRVTGRYSIDY